MASQKLPVGLSTRAIALPHSRVQSRYSLGFLLVVVDVVFVADVEGRIGEGEVDTRFRTLRQSLQTISLIDSVPVHARGLEVSSG